MLTQSAGRSNFKGGKTDGQSLHAVEQRTLGAALELGRRCVDLFIRLQGEGDLGPTVTIDGGRTLHRSEEPVGRAIRTVFGTHTFCADVDAPGPKKKIALRPIDARLGLPEGEYSYLLEEFSQYFCIEQAFDKARQGIEKVLGQNIPVDSLERISRRVAPAADVFLDNLPAPPAEEEGELLVRVCDGQECLWTTGDACLAAEYHETVATIDVLDIVHVTKYVWLAARAFCRANRKQAERFARDRLLRILRGDVQGVVLGLRQMATKRRLRGQRLADVTTACHDMQNNAERMHDDDYLAEGYPIASGVIEGACRHLVKDRMERSGMRWGFSGAESILTLRALQTSELWDCFQQQRIAEDQARLHPYRHHVHSYTPPALPI